MFQENAIEQQLEKDGAGLYTAAIVKEFRTQAAQLKRGMDAGLPGEEAQNFAKARLAFDTAASFLEEIWEESQSDNNDFNHHEQEGD